MAAVVVISTSIRHLLSSIVRRLLYMAICHRGNPEFTKKAMEMATTQHPAAEHHLAAATHHAAAEHHHHEAAHEHNQGNHDERC
jgi:hypothetical protein